MAINGFEIGDVVYIKRWDDMVNEFGLDCGNIPCKYGFVREMRRFCGQLATITCVYEGRVTLDFFSHDLHLASGEWNFSTDMIKHVNKGDGNG